MFFGVTFSCAVSTHANIISWVKDRKCALLLVLYAGSACYVSSTPGNAASFIFGFSFATNIGDSLGGITLGGGCVCLFLSYDCCIGLSNLRGGLVLLVNGDAEWVILVVSFTWCYVINFLLVYRFLGSDLVWRYSMLLLVVFSLNIFFSCNNYCTEDSFRWCGILFLSAYARLTDDAMIESSGVTVGFGMYLCLKNTVSDTIGVRVLFTHRLKHW